MGVCEPDLALGSGEPSMFDPGRSINQSGRWARDAHPCRRRPKSRRDKREGETGMDGETTPAWPEQILVGEAGVARLQRDAASSERLASVVSQWPRS